MHSGDIVITYGGDAHNLINGETITHRLITNGNERPSWQCYSDDIADKHLPAACR